MPATKKSNISIRLRKKPLTVNYTYSNSLGVNWSDFIGQNYTYNCVINPIGGFPSSVQTHQPSPEQTHQTPSEQRDYELYYKDSLVCRDADKNKLRRISYLIRKNMEK